MERVEKVQRFEDLIAWQKARGLTKEIYLLTRSGDFARDYGLASQIQRTAVSVMSNIVEGFERQGTLEYTRFLTISKASCAEVRAQLYVALDIGYIQQDAFEKLARSAEEVSRILGGLKHSLEKRK